MDAAVLTAADLQLSELLMKPAVRVALLPELMESCLFKDVLRSFWHKDKIATAGPLMQDPSPHACALANCALMS